MSVERTVTVTVTKADAPLRAVCGTEGCRLVGTVAGVEVRLDLPEHVDGECASLGLGPGTVLTLDGDRVVAVGFGRDWRPGEGCGRRPGPDGAGGTD